MTYKISVIIPVYNVEKYIGECIDSIINQTVGIENIELIFVNDCTPDNSMDIVKDYAKRYSSIKIIEHSKNQGLGPARNTGLKHVTSDYISFIDSDDIISNNTYEIALNHLINNDVDLFVYEFKLFSASGKKYNRDLHQEIFQTNQTIENIKTAPKVIFANGCCNKVFHKKFIPLLNFPSIFYEDIPISTEVFFNANKIYVTNKCTYFYRQREDEESKSILDQSIKKKCIDLSKATLLLYDLSQKYPQFKDLAFWINLHFTRTVLVWMFSEEFKHSERRKVFLNEKYFLNNVLGKDIDAFNLYFHPYAISKNIMLDTKNKNYLSFYIKYKHYLPLKKRLKKFRTLQKLKKKAYSVLKIS